MSAYLVAQIKVEDADTYGRYREQVAPLVAATADRFLVRDGSLEVVEGDWPLPLLVVIEFQSREAARHFYDSREYQRILPLRTEASRGTVAIVDGI
jgi:uncharacterized protein (DUF1330 family)